jgi:hypothetical protein
MADPTAGWYQDPRDPTVQRWWDGAAWTAQVRAAGDEPEGAPGPATGRMAPGEEPPSTRPNMGLLVAVLAGVLLLGVAVTVGLVLASDDGTPDLAVAPVDPTPPAIEPPADEQPDEAEEPAEAAEPTEEPEPPQDDVGSPEAAASDPVPEPPAVVEAGSGSFVLPSGNIGCLLVEGMLWCEIGSGLEPPPGDTCPSGWGVVTLAPAGPGEPSCSGARDISRFDPSPVLGYGETWSDGGISCTARETGLSCANETGGYLFLSRARWEAG